VNRLKIAQLSHIAVASAEWVNWYNTTRYRPPARQPPLPGNHRNQV